jgi:HK97 gp10 family phage protein
MRKVLRTAAKPVADRAKELAPRDKGNLAESITVSPNLNRSQRSQNRKGSFADLEMHIGPSGLAQGITQEFGTVNHAAQPFMRPAWEGIKDDVLTEIGKLAWAEVEKKARR